MASKPHNLLMWLALGLGVLTVLVTLTFFVWWAFKERFMFGDKAYDPVRWMVLSADPQSACQRGEMVHDIRNRLLRPGMGRNEVTALLGRPEWEDPRQIEYELGTCAWVVHGLRLYFNDEGRLVHAAIVQH